MTSVLPEEETKISKMKQKLMSKVPAKEETRSFLSFSRENLSISQSELEQGFHRYRFRPNRNTILSVAAFTVALLCLGLELWKLHYTFVDRREIEELKRDVESLKYHLLGEDIFDKLKTFEEQLYAQEPNDEDEDPGEADIDSVDYDSNYDDDTFSLHDYSPDDMPSYGARPSDFPDSSSTISPVPSPPEPQEIPGKDMMELLAAVRKAEVKHGQELKKNAREGHRHVDRDRLLEQRAKKMPEDKSQESKNSTKQKRDVLGSENAEFLSALKHRRSADRNHMKKNGAAGSGVAEESNGSLEARSKHPPKKYKASSSAEREANDRSVEHRPKKSARNLRKNSRPSRAVVAAHYGADRGKLSTKDAEHFGNGRVRHFDTVFKAWSPSQWVEGLRMNQHLEMKENGSLVVHQDGLYLVYAQIFYIDDRNQAGFHLKVNNQAILHCSVMNNHASRSSTGTQSCFSAQVTLLHKNDVLVLQEASDSSRFTLLEAEKTFLGLVRLGEKPR